MTFCSDDEGYCIYLGPACFLAICLHAFLVTVFTMCLLVTSLTLKVLVATIDALGHFETG